MKICKFMDAKNIFHTLAISVSASVMLYGCNSPYSAQEIPEIRGVNSSMIGADVGEITFNSDLPNDCVYRKDAVMLRSASLAIKYSYDHFEYSEGDNSRLRFLVDCKKDLKPVKVYFCRGTCTTMYSADSISHVLVPKFARSIYSEPRYGLITTRAFELPFLSK